MTRLAITVEGPTEKAFVEGLLTGHLRGRGVEAIPILIGRGEGPGVGGGSVSVKRLVAEMTHLLRSFDAVTCLVDFYGFRKKGDATVGELEERIRERVARRARSARRARGVFPYVQRHEFEALLFSDVSCFGELAGVSEDAVESLRRIRSGFSTPEDIDDGRETAPSKRILAALPCYRKVDDGRELALRIGLPTIRAECPRFDQWIRRLESLGEDRPIEGGAEAACS